MTPCIKLYYSGCRSRPPRSCQQLYADGKHAEILAQVEACLPKDEAGNFIVSQEKSDVLHDLLAFLAEKMLEMNRAEANGDQRFPGLAGELPGRKGGGPHAQDQIAKLLRARL